MTKIHAKIRIVRLCSTGDDYYWTARVLGAECSKDDVYYKTAAYAERAAIRWCERLGFDCTITVDKGIRT